MKKALFVLVISVLVLFLAGIVGLYLYLDEERVSGKISELLGDEFTTKIEQVSLGLAARSVTLRDVTVVVEREGNTHDVFVGDEVTVSGIGLFKAIAGHIYVDLVSARQFYFDPTLIRSGVDDQMEERDLPKMKIREIDFSQVTLPFRYDDLEGILDGVNLNVLHIEYDPDDGERAWTERMGEVELSIDRIDMMFWDERYELIAEELQYNEAESLFSITNTTIVSPLTDSGFFESLGYRTDLFDAQLGNLRLTGLDVDQFRAEREITADKLEIEGLDLHITQDRSYDRPEGDERTPMPQIALMELGTVVDIEAISMTNADIRYSEYPEEGGDSGTIYFGSINAEFSRISNRSFEPISIDVQALLEGEGELDVAFQLAFEGDEAVVTVDGRLGEFDPTLMNHILYELEGMEIKEGEVSELLFTYSMGQDEASGRVSVTYSGLELSMSNRDNEGLRGRLSDFVTNTFVIRSSGDEREADIHFERDKERGFFHYLWASLRSGLLDAVRRV